ncbi:hypothetical protein QFC19_005382 [Naganishia cerealis]|uniref:Uncharacterized protein n=1 Tax=Naganishia cerealis TaxID=610337 RepID=A0ACC2VPD3_9TREE|nr:hypothetical protein QFC19_005382 [Naganishia cerealis]
MNMEAPQTHENAEAGPSSLSTCVVPSAVPSTDNDGNNDATPQMSKSAMKKAARRARAESEKLVRRAAEKERRKANAAKRKADLQAGLLSKDEVEELRKKHEAVKLRKRLRAKGGDLVKDDDKTWKGGIIVDCGFDELMTDQEIVSMTNQLYFVHALNRMSSKPFRHCVFTGVNGRMKERLENKLHGEYKKFSRMEWRSEDVKDVRDALSRSEEEWENFKKGKKLARGANPFEGQEYVYLSADAEYELESLSESETYIIGGIVDRNRYKNLCQNKAEKLGIKTARLPIGKYLADMPTRKVLTVNQVFEILLKFNELGSWQLAMEAVMPQRKYQIGGKRAMRKLAARQGGTTEADEDESKCEEGHAEDEIDQEASGDDSRVPEAVAGHMDYSDDETPVVEGSFTHVEGNEGNGKLDEEEMANDA